MSTVAHVCPFCRGVWYSGEQSPWVACAKRMPTETGNVLCWAECWDEPTILTRYTGPGGDPWLDPESTCPVAPRHWPTHWMPLPAAPARLGAPGGEKP